MVIAIYKREPWCPRIRKYARTHSQIQMELKFFFHCVLTNQTIEAFENYPDPPTHSLWPSYWPESVQLKTENFAFSLGYFGLA